MPIGGGGCSNSEGSYFDTEVVPIRRGPILVKPEGPNSEGSQFGGVLFSLIQMGPNSDGSYFCQPGEVSIRRGPIFVSYEGS